MMRKTWGSRMQIGLLLLPGVLIFGIFTLYPIAKLLIMSFFKWDFGSILNQELSVSPTMGKYSGIRISIQYL